MSQRLGDLLVKEKVITTEQLEQATKVQKETNCRLGSALVKLGFLTDEDVTNFLSRQYGVPAINLSYFEIDPSVVKLIPFETAKRYQILPLSRVGASLTIAMVDPTNVFAMDDIKFMTGFNIEPVVASESSILEGIEKAYGTTQQEDLEQVMQSMTEVSDADVELQSEETEMELADLELLPGTDRGAVGDQRLGAAGLGGDEPAVGMGEQRHPAVPGVDHVERLPLSDPAAVGDQ